MKQLEIKNLSHSFGGLMALSGINLSLENGEIVGLIGPNGAGKTTIFNLVSGFYVPTSGDIFVDGVRINGKTPHEIAAMKVGRTFQNIRLWSEMSVLDNIRISQYYHLGYNVADALFHTKRYRAREAEITRTAYELLDIFHLADLAEECPKNFPYGIQRRVEIVRALSLNPKLLMLDEPAAGLSSADIILLIDYVNWIHDEFKLTIWLIEHQIEVVMSLCGRIQVIDFGKEIAIGSPKEIRSNDDVIKAYLGDEEL
ncbi:MAG: ABC transporter ATP-binding protein [Treponema sp.]|jgi:branched-chain amino acid transport system ATP-binding protein|nr:ABC transporter ATP-binding protein [Treponema sp.]